MRSSDDYMTISILIILFGTLWVVSGVGAVVMLYRDNSRAAHWLVACLVFFIMFAMVCSVPAGEA